MIFPFPDFPAQSYHKFKLYLRTEFPMKITYELYIFSGIGVGFTIYGKRVRNPQGEIIWIPLQ